jgi:hypothetical protein
MTMETILTGWLSIREQYSVIQGKTPWRVQLIVVREAQADYNTRMSMPPVTDGQGLAVLTVHL